MWAFFGVCPLLGRIRATIVRRHRRLDSDICGTRSEPEISRLPHIRNFAKQQLFGYMGMGASDEEQPWIKDYIEKMMKDRKYIEDAYNRIQSQKILDSVETQLKPEEKEISSEDFTKMVESHQHHH